MKYIDNKLKAKIVKLEDANNNYTSENVEGALEEIDSKIKHIEANGYDDTKIKQDINNIKTEVGTEELTTTDQTIKGAVNEVNSQIKDIPNLFTTEQTTNSYKIKCGNKVIAEIPLGSSTPTVIKYVITNMLSNATNSNSASEIEENQPYTATITANEGYSINSVIITMDGTDITNTVYNNGNINISSVTGNLIITVECTEIVQPTSYSITNNLTNYKNSNATKSIAQILSM